jgi:hypothetical protein
MKLQDMLYNLKLEKKKIIYRKEFKFKKRIGGN